MQESNFTPHSQPSLSILSTLQTLQESLMQLQSAVMITQAADANSTMQVVRSFNPLLQTLTNYSEQELMHMPVNTLLAGMCSNAMLHSMLQLINKQETVHIHISSGEGSEAASTFLLEAIPFVDVMGNDFCLWLKTSAEKNYLNGDEGRWRLALDGIGDGIWDWNLSDDSVIYSQSWKNMLGFEDNEIPSQLSASRERIYTQDLPEVLRQLQSHIQGEKNAYQCEYRLRCKDETYKWVLDRGRIVSWNNNGKPLRMIGVCSDISTRKKTEELLQESEERHRVLIDNLQSGVVVHAPDTSILLCNLQASNLLAYSLAQMQAMVIGKPEWFFVDSDKIPLAIGEYPVNYVVNNLQRITDKMLGIQQRDHEHIDWLMINAYPEYAHDKELSHIVVTFVELTEHVVAKEKLRLSEERFQLATSGSSFGVWDWKIQSDEMYFSERCKQMLGYSDKEMFNDMNSLMALVHPDDEPLLREAINKHLSGDAKAFEVEMRLKSKRKGYLYFYARGEAIRNEAGKPYRMAGSIIDISIDKKTQEELEVAAMVYKHSSEAMMVNDSNDKIIAINPAFTALTGYEAEEVLGSNSHFYMNDVRNKALLDEIESSLLEKGYWQGEIWSKRKNGEDIAESLTINAIHHQDGSVHRYVSLFSDITEKRKSEELIWYQANYDQLTDLPNRNMFIDKMQCEIGKGRRETKHFILLFIDLDHFKEVNDTLGHQIGDELLIEASQRIKNCIRQTDIVARQGGDEFCVMLYDLKEPELVQRVVQKIIDALSDPFHLGDEKVFISASIGITLYPEDSSNMDDLFKFADQAMYQAKNAGRNRYSYFTQDLQLAADERRFLTRELRNAIAAEQFAIYYQPIVELKNNRVHKAEALIRWSHPEKGIINPNDFIPLAEESGLIVDLGNWIFKKAAKQAQQWRNTFSEDFQISINKSPVQFIEEGSGEKFNWLDYLEGIGLDGKAIVVEITEGILLDTPALVLEKMKNFHDAGIGLSLDDFGTGYSSLSYLKKFDIDFIKIDRAFVMHIENDKGDQALCEAIIVMAHKLGLQVIAEGIENTKQLNILKSAGCDYGQGYLFSRPIPVDDFSSYLDGQC